MAAVLLMVGRGQEAPEVVQQLLDIQVHMDRALSPFAWHHAPWACCEVQSDRYKGPMLAWSDCAFGLALCDIDAFN